MKFYVHNKIFSKYYILFVEEYIIEFGLLHDEWIEQKKHSSHESIIDFENTNKTQRQYECRYFLRYSTSLVVN